MNIDLHTHSDNSDGALNPAELVAAAVAAGVEILALTDHDTVRGVENAARAASAQGLTLVPGVEVSCGWRSQSIHVLGLWVDPTSRGLLLALEGQAEIRRARMRNLCGSLSRLRLPGETLLAAVESQPGLPTRTHLAQAMVAAGIVANSRIAFRKYLGNGKLAHAAVAWPALPQAVAWILAAGGAPVLAHPLRYPLSAGARRRLLGDFAAAGGTAVEIMSGGNAAQQVEACSRMAVAHGLKGSVGSDFHSPRFAWNPLGRSLKLPDCITPVWRGRLP